MAKAGFRKMVNFELSASVHALWCAGVYATLRLLCGGGRTGFLRPIFRHRMLE